MTGGTGVDETEERRLPAARCCRGPPPALSLDHPRDAVNQNDVGGRKASNVEGDDRSK
jgi:hypothetical protein